MELKKLVEIQNRIDKINTENKERGIDVNVYAHTSEQIILNTTDTLEYHDTLPLIKIWAIIGYGTHSFTMDIASVILFLEGFAQLKTPADFAGLFNIKK